MKKTAKLNLKVMLIKDLIPADYNPRKDLNENDLQYKQLKKSIEQFEYVDPLIFNTKTNTLISGHQRLKVLKELGYEEIEVNCVDLNKTKEKALNIALNKITGEWDDEKLSSIIIELSELEDFDFEAIGFGDDELNCPAFEYSGVLDGIENNIFSKTINDLKDTFSISFEFSKKEQDIVQTKLKENGKQFYTERLLEVFYA